MNVILLNIHGFPKNDATKRYVPANLAIYNFVIGNTSQVRIIMDTLFDVSRLDLLDAIDSSTWFGICTPSEVDLRFSQLSRISELWWKLGVFFAAIGYE